VATGRERDVTPCCAAALKPQGTPPAVPPAGDPRGPDDKEGHDGITTVASGSPCLSNVSGRDTRPAQGRPPSGAQRGLDEGIDVLIGPTPSEPRRLDPRAGQADEPLDDALRRAREGDESGFAELWRDLQPRLLRYLRVRAGDGCEDVAAETWLQVLRDLPRFIGNADGFRAWLFTIARNRAIDAARAASVRPAVPVADVSEHAAAGIADPAEVGALERISTERALELVSTLPGEQPDMVLLRVVAGLDVATVADIVGKSPGAVRVSVHRGLRALARNPRVRPTEVI
jgi:RNA polymerase sigma-70 factor (ECF subfamily)